MCFSVPVENEPVLVAICFVHRSSNASFGICSRFAVYNHFVRASCVESACPAHHLPAHHANAHPARIVAKPRSNLRGTRANRYMRPPRPPRKSGLCSRKHRVDSTRLAPPAFASAADRPPKPEPGRDSIPIKVPIARSIICDSISLPVHPPHAGVIGGSTAAPRQMSRAFRRWFPPKSVPHAYVVS